MPSTSLLYRALIRCGIALAPLLARGRPKLQAGLAGRDGLLERLESWARAQRDPARPLLWMHAASRGEALQAEAVLRQLRRSHPEWQFVFTYFSPSAAPLAAELPVDLADYLPWDRRADVDAALASLQPTALVFSKLDLWPELATRAAARGVPVGIIGAAVSERARRLRWPARSLSRAGYQAVTAAGAVREGDAVRLAALGVARERIELTGDPRFDSVLERARAVRSDDPRPGRAIGAGSATLVAGSTWPADEDVLLTAFRVLQNAQEDVRLVLVPHEPTAEHLERLDHAARQRGLEPTRWSPTVGPQRLLVVDRVGMLATLYSGAGLAYVGGGFGTAGLHSVLEPAACGVVVLFGPRGRDNPDAEALLQRRAAAVVSPEFPDWLDLDSQATHAGSPLAALWLALLRHPAHLRAAGRRALEYVEAGAGAAARNAGLVERLMRERAAVSVR
ncbi:MAG TPA: glycosyltransferase N-terminal domain-containing protein [Gemmatimonadales bacterium]|nr:glycosyltransferase N-terminal domain-containing protein [Gemmatimonadales bacterium]